MSLQIQPHPIPPQGITRAMTGTTMPQPSNQVAPPIPVFGTVWLITPDFGSEIQAAPKRQRPLRPIRPAQLTWAILTDHRGDRFQERPQGIEVPGTDPTELHIGKRRVQQTTVTRSPVPHRPSKVLRTPGAQTGDRIRRQVGRIDPAERRFDRTPPRIRLPASRSMTGSAITQPGQVSATRHLGCHNGGNTVSRHLGRRFGHLTPPHPEQASQCRRGQPKQHDQSPDQAPHEPSPPDTSPHLKGKGLTRLLTARAGTGTG